MTRSTLWCRFVLAPCFLLLSTLPAMADDAAPAGEAEIEEEYAYLQSSFLSNTEFRLRHIVVAEKAQAEQIIQRIKQGERFAELAPSLSLDLASRHKGGDLGWRNAQAYLPDIAKVIKPMRAGELALQPVQSKFGWHVLQVEDTRPEVLAPLDKVHQRLSSELNDKFVSIARASLRGVKPEGYFFSVPHGPAVIRRLLAAGAKPDIRAKNGITPLMDACRAGSQAALQLLLDAGAEAGLRVAGVTAFEYCVYNPRVPASMLQSLLDKGASATDFNSDGMSPLHIAAKGGSLEAIRLLLARGIAVDQLDRNGLSPLMYAAQAGRSDAVHLLLALGANPLTHASAEPGKTALSYAFAYSLQRWPEPALLSELRQKSLQRLAQLRPANLAVYIVQDKQRYKLDSQVITLQRKPFTLEFELPGAVSVYVQAMRRRDSLDALLSKPAYSAFGNALNIGAEAQPHEPVLFVSDGPQSKFHSWWENARESNFDKVIRRPQFSLAQRRVARLLVDGDSGQPMQPTALGKEPIFVLAAVGETIGSPFVGMQAYRWAEIRWR